MPRPPSRVYEWYVKVLFTTKSSGITFFFIFFKISPFRVINENNDLSPSANLIIHELTACHHFVINWQAICNFEFLCCRLNDLASREWCLVMRLQ